MPMAPDPNADELTTTRLALEMCRDRIASLELRLRRAEDVCAVVGWGGSYDETEETTVRSKALVALWQAWARHAGSRQSREGSPHLTDVYLEALAKQTDATRDASRIRANGGRFP